MQSRHHLRHGLAQIELLACNRNLAAGAGTLEPPLERTHNSPTWFALLLERLPSMRSSLS
jgi:hypothetical protein